MSSSIGIILPWPVGGNVMPIYLVTPCYNYADLGDDTPNYVAMSIDGDDAALRAKWRPIEFSDIPSRDEFEKLTLQFLRRGITNSDRMRQEICRARKLILRKSTGRWNETPSDKFTNEHAWVLEDLVVRKVIERVATKEYRLLQCQLPIAPDRKAGWRKPRSSGR
jgi:hypothetical protein